MPSAAKSKTIEYKAWVNMRSRCYTPTSTQYEDYGGRGIKVCERWNASFENFYDDMGAKPSPKHSLDRIDVNKDYTPENCRWSDYNLQNHNQRLRATNKSGFNGVSKEKRSNKWLATIWNNYTMIYLGLYEDSESAALAYDAAAVQIYGANAKLNLLRVS